MFWKKKPKYQTPQATDANFNELVAQSEIPVLVDFYADWCGPCKVVGPIIDELAQEYEGKALVVKVNTEALIPKPNLEEILDEYIAENAAES